jgi:hypothetical protein
MRVVEELVSECCGEASIMTIENIDDGAWGRCSNCDKIAMFEDAEKWPDADEDEDENYKIGPTGHPATIPETYTDAERLVDIFGGDTAPSYVDEFITNFGGPSTISWITDSIGITSKEGADIALKQGHFVINTANEIHNKAQVKIPIYHDGPDNLRRFKAIQNVMDGVLLESDQKVVVHCAMGMERSVTAVVWYLANTTNMTLIEALKHIQSIRPIACDRLYFITR